VNANRLRVLVRRLPQPVVLWMYDPCFASLIGRCGEAASVYDCVDDYAADPNNSVRERAFIATADERAARRATVVFTTTGALFERHRLSGAQVYLVGNAADYEHFSQADGSIAAPELAGVKHPIVGFSGNLLAGKVDFGVMEALARARPDWTLVLIGPAQRGVDADLARLTALPNVRWLGARRYEDLPGYIAHFDVGLCPYLWNDWMRGGFPLKLYEYLAAGKPVVASGNPDVAGMEPDVAVARGADEFVAAVERALLLGSAADRERRRRLAAGNTWDAKTERLRRLVGASLPALC
jgi:glycosyltransferase involved in cell wall biosynthesis